MSKDSTTGLFALKTFSSFLDMEMLSNTTTSLLEDGFRVLFKKARAFLHMKTRFLDLLQLIYTFFFMKSKSFGYYTSKTKT
jgi:hypothetical protein